MKQTILKKLNSKAGFNLTETLVTILLMTIVLSAVTGGIEAARRAYQSVRLKADAQMLRATTITEISTEFERAKDIEIEVYNKNAINGFYSERRGGVVKFKNDGWNGGKNNGKNNVGITITDLSASDSFVELVTDDTRGATTLYTKFEKKDKNDVNDPGVPFFVGEIRSDKSLSGYIQYTIKVYNHKVSNSEDESEDQELASQTVYVRPVLCQ